MTRFYGGLCCERDRRLVWCACNWCYRTRRAVGVSDSSGTGIVIPVCGFRWPDRARANLAGKAIAAPRNGHHRAISTLRCTFVPTELGERGLRIQVLVGAAQGSHVDVTFDHRVVRTASPE